MSLVSVIIPAYNSERFLGEAISSVMAQQVPTEIFVVDDGSTDGTKDVARKFPVTYLYQANSGQASARNLGAQACRGDFIAFLDSDDLWPENKLQVQLKYLQEKSDIDMIFGHASQFRDGVYDKALPAKLASTMLIRRSSWEATPGFDSRWRVGEFVDWCLRAEESGLKSYMLPDTMLFRRLHEDNLGSSGKGRDSYVQILKLSLDRRRSSGSPKK